MSRAKLPLLLLFALVVILGACQSEGKIEGEVFIVTEGRENIEMGLVGVKAIEASAFDGHLKERHSQSKEEVRSLAREAASLLDSLSVAQQLYEERKAEYERAQAEYSDVAKEYRMKLGSFNPSPQASKGDRVAVALERKKIILRGKPDFSSAEKGYMTSGDLGTVLDVVKDEMNTFYKIESEDSETGWTGYVGRLVEPDEDIIYSKRELEERVGKAKRLYKRVESVRSDISSRLEDTFGQIASYREQDYYYRDMPSAHSSSETGSDGNYELTVEGGVPYYIVAQASRSVGDEEEHYYWMVETTVERGETKEVNLSNDNLGGVANQGYALRERTLSTVRAIWGSAVSLAKEGEQDWEKLIYRTAFPQDTTDAPLPDGIDVPEEKLLSDR
jgi:hypothetical protein